MFGVEKNKKNTVQLDDNEIDFIIESAYLQDKRDYGRVRTSLSKYFRAKYGNHAVNKVLSRLDKRKNGVTCWTKLNQDLF